MIESDKNCIFTSSSIMCVGFAFVALLIVSLDLYGEVISKFDSFD